MTEPEREWECLHPGPGSLPELPWYRLTLIGYYIDESLVRSDITEDREGAPLLLGITVQELGNCTPLQNASVDIWHCDAADIYSGIVGESPGGGTPTTGNENANTTFLRGIHYTGSDELASFATIYPGWCTSRTVHIHMKVHVGGDVVHTGQLFFDDAVSDAVFALDAYDRTSNRDTDNDEDSILGDHEGEADFMVALTALGNSASDGYAGTVTVYVNPDA